MDNPIEISIVSTIFNDEAVVPFLISEIQENVEKLNVSYEVILVIDGRCYIMYYGGNIYHSH